MRILLCLVALAVFAVSAQGGEMVLIPGGTYIIGLSDKHFELIKMMGGKPQSYQNATPSSEVELKPFYIDKYEVTNREYAEFDKTHEYPPSKADYPVVNLSWHQASEYARWCGKRLPTEQEWEAAARGEFGRIFPWGEDPDATKCRSKDITYKNDKAASEIFSFPDDKSPYGVLGMGGNVSEWTSSYYLKYKGSRHDGKNYSKRYRVVRGGSFLYPFFDSVCASRRAATPDTKNVNIGMRLVMDFDEYKKQNAADNNRNGN